MTEEQWLAGTDPIAMVEFLRGSPTGEDAVTWWDSRWRAGEAQTANDRRFRLFACACCRRVWDRIPEPCNRDAVAAVEDYLDGRLPAAALQAAFVVSSAVEWKEDGSGRRSEPGYWSVKYLGRGFYKMTAGASALMVAARVLFGDVGYGREAWLAFSGCFYAANGVFLRPFVWPVPVPAAVEAERTAQAALLRCIFGNPFKQLAFDPSWRTSTCVALSSQMYESRDFSVMAILADALQDAGCENEDILAHCRARGPHVRGCWVVDHLLERA